MLIDKELREAREALAAANARADAAVSLANENAFVGARHKDRADAAEEALAAARLECEELREEARRAKAATEIAKVAREAEWAGRFGVELESTDLREALAVVRREVEGLKEKMAELAGALSEAADDIGSHDINGFREALREGATAITDAIAGPAITTEAAV